MYLELDQAPPGWIAPPRTNTQRPTTPALPRTTLTLGNAAGRARSPQVPRGRLLATAHADASPTQWDTAAAAGVEGVELFLEGRLVAAIPTTADGPGTGVTHAIPIALAAPTPGRHSVELRLSGVDGTTTSTLRHFDLLP